MRFLRTTWRSRQSMRGFGLAAIAAAALCATTAMAEPSVYPTGVTRYDPALAYNCYVIFDGRDGKTHLIDMDGHEINTWNYIGFPGEMLSPRLAGGKRGHVLVQLYDKPPRGPAKFGNVFNNVEVGEADWSGKVVWKWGLDAPGGAARQNHDLSRLANGDTLLISSQDHAASRFKGATVHDQVIYEIAPSGKVVWTWRAADHLHEFGFSAEGLKLIYADQAVGGGIGGFLTLNSMKALGPNHWYEAGDARFNPNNILIGSREGSFLAIIDKVTGHIVWRVGPYYPRAAKGAAHFIFDTAVPRPLDRLSGQHDPNMIGEGLPGAGDILVLDNEGQSGYPPMPMSIFQGSRVLEINPVTQKIIWQYTAENSGRDVWTFDTSLIGSVRRLPNGNTLIDEGLNGRIFQVTPKGRIVWEYVDPFFRKGSEGGQVVMTNTVFRAQPVPYSWVPAATPHDERPVIPPDPATYHLPESESHAKTKNGGR